MFKGKITGCLGSTAHPRERMNDAVVRIARTLCGVELKAALLKPCAQFSFHERNTDNAVAESLGPVYTETQYLYDADAALEPQRSHSFEPAWHAFDAVPFDEMPEDDRHWYPLALQGKLLQGTFTFDGPTLLHHEVKESTPAELAAALGPEVAIEPDA